jgi:hypothetical protein
MRFGSVSVSLNPADVANAQLGISLPVIYGFVRGQGNEVLNHALPSKNRIVIRILSEGEIDGIDRLYINSKVANAADTTLVHFHPGIDGVLGHGLTPDSNGGDQLVDNFWSQLPANFVPTTFSRKAYLMLNVPPDPAAPSATLTVVGDYRGCKVRQFDSSSNQTGYAFSTNGAEQCLDAILRTMLKPEWNPSAAAAGGGDLVAAEKARIDWAAYADAVAWCNTLLANGQKRFESSMAFAQQTPLIDALKQLCMMSQLYITEAAGRIFIRADEPRASTFIMTSSHVVAGAAQFDKINLHGAQNRFIANYNDLNAQGIADIDIPANIGLVRSGTGFVTVLTKTNHPFTVGMNVQVVPPIDGSSHDGAFDGMFPITSLPAANKFMYAQAGRYNDLLWSEDFTNAVWTKQTNITVTGNTQVDPLGGTTADTISSGVTAGQGVFQPSGLTSTNGVQYTFSVWLKAAANTAASILVDRSAAGAGADVESLAITVTNVWQRFTFTHSATWTGAQAVTAAIVLTNAASAIFAWGAQLEDGTVATTYRQTTSAPNGVVSGNGTVGTPESRFALRAPVVDHQQHQNAIGQRGLSLTPIFRVVPITVNMGNNTDERVKRILNFLSARNLGLPTTPYVAPWSGTVTCFMDAVDVNNNALISQLCGDIITIDATVSEEYQADYEIMKAVYTVPAADGSNNSSGGQSNFATIDLTLTQYLAAAFSDTSLVAQSLRASIPSGLVPIAQVDSLGIQRLAGTFQNNPTNVQSYFTGANPLSQSSTSTTILIASNTIQFGAGQVSYNSGSVNPGSYGTYTVYARDPKFTGGAVTYLVVLSTALSTLSAFDDIVCFGSITTTSGGGAHGTGGGGGACFSGNVKVRTPRGPARFEALDPVCVIETEFGPRLADVIVREYCGEMRDMGNRELVTPSHLIKKGPGWLPASLRWERVVQFEGKVFTLRVHTEIDEERHFILEDGTVAHNISPPPL